MKNVVVKCEILTILISVLFVILADGASEKYRLCVVEGAKSKKTFKYCPILEKDDSKVKCVFGTHRLDCLMKISRGKADFTVLEAEDVVVASNTKDTDILITNNIRFLPERLFAYEVIALVRNDADIQSLSDLQGKNLCHPGYGYEPQWTDVISRFFEARVVPQLCNTDLTLAENRIKSSASYFKAACKAGPWVPNYNLDSKLKSKYPNLCELCDNPNVCSATDKYWGRQGALFCLTDGVGDVAWARLDDTKGHFALNETGTTPIADPKQFSYLCPNGTIQPISAQNDPCIWLARPWPSVAASKASATQVQKIVSNLTAHLNDTITWERALDSLLTMSFAEEITPLTLMETAADYLEEATGFTSANSLSDCTPGRPVRVCTSSSDEYAKCGWLKEASKAFGLEPDISCLEAKSPQDCMKVVQKEAADVVIVNTDLQLVARRDYGLSALLYEFSSNVENLYNAAIVVKINSSIKQLGDLRGRKACFPSFEGVAWTSLIEIMKNKTMLPKTCPYQKAIGEFFSDSCVPGLQKTSPDFQPKLRALCKDDPIDPLLVTNDADKYSGESGAFHCLANGAGDVAFIDLATIRNNTDGANKEEWAVNLKAADFRSLCVDNSTKKCYLSWATPGQVMIKSNTSELRAEELLIAFLNLDNSFGKRFKTQTPAFQLFGSFDGKNNIMFHDATHRLEDYESVRRDGLPLRNYEEMIMKPPKCSAASVGVLSTIVLILSISARLVLV